MWASLGVSWTLPLSPTKIFNPAALGGTALNIPPLGAVQYLHDLAGWLGGFWLALAGLGLLDLRPLPLSPGLGPSCAGLGMSWTVWGYLGQVLGSLWQVFGKYRDVLNRV